MIEHPNGESLEPRPEELAAYADGELDTASRRRVGEWLAEHPEAAAEVKAFGRLRQLSRTVAPPEPTEAQWAAVLSRIAADLPAAPAKLGLLANLGRFRTAAAVLLGLALAAGAAAVVVLVLGPFRPAPLPGGPHPDLDLETPLPLVSAGDVEIISMDGADLKALVVGEPPLRSDVKLVCAKDVEEIHIEDNWEDRVRVIGMDGSDDAVPMVVVAMPGK
jgi:anti-sigma factor RsiW